MQWLKIPIGVAFLAGGGALLFWSAAGARLALMTPTRGLPLLILIGVALGLACLGAGLDFFGCWRATNPAPKIRNTKVYGAAEPASEGEARAAATGGVRAPLHDRTFTD